MLETVQYRNPMKSVYSPVFGEGCEVHWFEGGSRDNPTVLLIHGYMAHSLTFRRVVDDFADHFHVVVIDLPAHGKDRSFLHESVDPSLRSLVGWLNRIVAELDPAHVISHSLGATMAYHAFKSAATIETLTLADPGMWLPARRMDKWVMNAVPTVVARLFAADTTMRIFERVQWEGTRMSKEERASYVAPLKDGTRLKFMIQLGQNLMAIADPESPILPPAARTLLLWGENDQLFASSDAPKMADRLKAEFTVFEGSGHSPAEDVPEQFIQRWFEFVRIEVESPR